MEGRSGAAPITLFDASAAAVTLRLRGQGLRSRRSPSIARSRGAPTASCTSPWPRRAKRWPTRSSTSRRTPSPSASDRRSRPASAACRRWRPPTSTSFEKGIDRMSPMWITMLIPNMASAMLSMEFGDARPVRHARRPRAPRRPWASATPRATSATAAPTSCSRADQRRRSRRSASAASTPCARSRSATTTRPRPVARSMPDATGS